MCTLGRSLSLWGFCMLMLYIARADIIRQYHPAQGRFQHRFINNRLELHARFFTWTFWTLVYVRCAQYKTSYVVVVCIWWKNEKFEKKTNKRERREHLNRKASVRFGRKQIRCFDYWENSVYICFPWYDLPMTSLARLFQIPTEERWICVFFFSSRRLLLARRQRHRSQLKIMFLEEGDPDFGDSIYKEKKK